MTSQVEVDDGGSQMSRAWNACKPSKQASILFHAITHVGFVNGIQNAQPSSGGALTRGRLECPMMPHSAATIPTKPQWRISPELGMMTTWGAG